MPMFEENKNKQKKHTIAEKISPFRLAANKCLSWYTLVSRVETDQAVTGRPIAAELNQT